MALPMLKSVQDCGNYALTVEPYIPQLYALPQQIFNNLANASALKQLYVDTNPLISGFAASVFFGGVFLVVSEINKNYSQVDRVWSILPTLYIYHFAVWARAAGVPHDRVDLVAAFGTLWSVSRQTTVRGAMAETGQIRLTYNYYRRGGYEIGSEDYRWSVWIITMVTQQANQSRAIVKRNLPSVLWFILNATFISFIQSVLLFAFSGVPTYAILMASSFQPKITTADSFYFLIQTLLVVSEWFSDGQQYRTLCLPLLGVSSNAA